MPKIFVSYRRDDTAGYAGRLFATLERHFGPGVVFFDVAGSIEPGERFDHAIERAIASSDAVLAVIGKDWLNVTDRSGRRRIEDPGDFVHLELRKALQRDTRVIPVLVEHAVMPSVEELPMDLQQLARHEAVEISDSRWEFDVARLIRALEKAVGAPTRSRPPRWRTAIGVGVLVIATSVGIWVWVAHRTTARDVTQQSQPTKVATPEAARPAPVAAVEPSMRKANPDRRGTPNEKTAARRDIRATPPVPAAVRLTLSLQSAHLTEPSGESLGSEEFTGDDEHKVIDRAAQWASEALNSRFPRTSSELSVTVGLARDGSTHRIVLEPTDPLRKDRFWMFTLAGMKEGHPTVVQSTEAIAEAITRAVATTGLGKIVLHLERPGYDLRAVEVHSGAPQTVILTRLPNPAYTAIVQSAPGIDAVAERLSNRLREHGLTVGNSDMQRTKRAAYQRSLAPHLSEGERLVHLRQARVDAFLTMSYNERR